MNAAAPASISSLVITLSPDPDAESQALAALTTVPGLELGPFHRPWIAAVLDSSQPKDAVRFIQDIPGIQFVEVTFVEVPPAEPALSANP